MKDTSAHITVQFLTETYTTYRPLVVRYIYRKLNGCLETEDLVQDAFLRLLEYRSMLRPETVRSFLYTIVRNLVTDYSASVEDMESAVMAKDLSCQEEKRVNQLSPKVRAVYSMSRFEGKSALEIAAELSIPKRTVEGYLLAGRKSVREYMRQCI